MKRNRGNTQWQRMSRESRLVYIKQCLTQGKTYEQTATPMGISRQEVERLIRTYMPELKHKRGIVAAGATTIPVTAREFVDIFLLKYDGYVVKCQEQEQQIKELQSQLEEYKRERDISRELLVRHQKFDQAVAQGELPPLPPSIFGKPSFITNDLPSSVAGEHRGLWIPSFPHIDFQSETQARFAKIVTDHLRDLGIIYNKGVSYGYGISLSLAQ